MKETITKVAPQAIARFQRKEIRLARYFGTTREFWMNLQSYYDLAIAEDQQAAIIEREVLPHESVR